MKAANTGTYSADLFYSLVVKKNKYIIHTQIRKQSCIMSCLPSAWENTKRKNTATFNAQRRNKRTRHDFSTKSHLETVHAALDKQLDKSSDSIICNELDFDPLLESMPFVKMLQNMTPPQDDKQDVIIVTRAYEEKFLRECMSNKEQQCVMGAKCECMIIDSTQPFVGVRFILPNALAGNDSVEGESTADAQRCAQDEGGMCLLCLRKITQILFYQSIHRGIQINGLIQKHGNICNESGEYHNNAMLICPPHGPVHSMPLPIVAHQRSNYTVSKCQGIHWITQKNVGFEDFR
jgi:hypothetical protein